MAQPMTILITRALPEAEHTAQRIIQLGHIPIIAPLFTVEAAPDPLPKAQPDRIIASSAKAFRYGAPLPPEWLHLPLHGVGEATGQEAKNNGFSCLHIAQGDAASLVADVKTKARQEENILYLAGNPRRPDIESGLLEAGLTLALLPRYHMVGVPTLPQNAYNALKAGMCDVVLHFSAEGARHMLRLSTKAGLLEELTHPFHFCLSHAIAAMVEAESAPSPMRIYISPKPEAESLLELLSHLPLK